MIIYCAIYKFDDLLLSVYLYYSPQYQT